MDTYKNKIWMNDNTVDSYVGSIRLNNFKLKLYFCVIAIVYLQLDTGEMGIWAFGGWLGTHTGVRAYTTLLDV